MKLGTSTFFPVLLIGLLALPASSGAVELPPISDGPSMSLPEALTATDRRNTQLQALRLEVDRAQAQLSTAWARILPQASAQMQYARADHADAVEVSGASIVIRRQNDVAGDLTLSMNLVDLQAWSNVGVAAQSEKMTGLSVEEARRQLLLATSQAYYMVEVSRSLVGMYAEQVRAAEEQLDVAKKKVNAGTGLRLDEIRAENDLAQAQQEYTDALLSLDTSRDALATLTGTEGLPLPQASPELPEPVGAETSLVRSAESRRLDLAVKAASIDLADRQLNSAWSGLLPTAGVAWQGSYQFTEPGAMGDTDRSRWTAVFTLNAPLFNWADYGQIESSKVALKQARVEEQDAKREAAKEIRQLRRKYLSAKSQVTIAERQVALAREGIELARTAFKAGSASSLEVTEARRSLVSAEVGQATARLQSKVSLAALHHALGGDLKKMAASAEPNLSPRP